MSEMIERVSEAMRLRSIERGHPIHPDMERHLAVAAIEAMREPTQEMVYTAEAEADSFDCVWRSMIDAALK
jgi:hypothetical protein